MARLVSLSDAATVHVWENALDREIRARDPLLDSESGLAGSGTNSLVSIKDDLSKGAGAYITTKMAYQLEGRGVANDETMKGNEDTYKFATDNVYVDVIRNAFKSDSPMGQQYVKEDIVDTGTEFIADWAATRMSQAMHAHAAGITLVSDPAYRLHNTINAVNSAYIIRPNSKAAGALTTGDIFDVDLLNTVAQFVKTVRPKLRPAQTPWGPRFCVFLHPDQVADLRASDTVWFQQMLASIQGGKIEDNPIFTTALGQQNGFLFFESDLVPPGLNSGATKFKDNTRRAWVGGAGALALAFGRGDRAPGFALNRWQWAKETEDYGFSTGVCAMSICGVKRHSYTKPGEASAREAGVVVVETYAGRVLSSATDAYAEWIRASGGASVEA